MIFLNSTLYTNRKIDGNHWALYPQSTPQTPPLYLFWKEKKIFSWYTFFLYFNYPNKLVFRNPRLFFTLKQLKGGGCSFPKCMWSTRLSCVDHITNKWRDFHLVLPMHTRCNSQMNYFTQWLINRQSILVYKLLYN